MRRFLPRVMQRARDDCVNLSACPTLPYSGQAFSRWLRRTRLFARRLRPLRRQPQDLIEVSQHRSAQSANQPGDLELDLQAEQVSLGAHFCNVIEFEQTPRRAAREGRPSNAESMRSIICRVLPGAGKIDGRGKFAVTARLGDD